MANRINKVTTRTKQYEAPKTVDGKLSYSLYDKDGNMVGQTLVNPGTDMSGAQDMYFTKGQNSLWQMSDIPKVNISLDTETNRIKITAPKSVTDTDQFKQFIDEDQLKLYSQAYRLNNDYKIQVQEKNEKTGEDETKEVTIPEYIERLNSSLVKYFENLRDQKAYARDVVKMYGDKAKNLTENQLVISAQGSKGANATYLPDTILTASSFGNGIDNPFEKLRNRRGDNDEISAEDLAEVWKRENFGREEVAALMALINGHLEGSNWDKDTYYKDADGNEVYNRNSADEAAKLIAFKNYVLNNNPHAEWYQQAGDWIESAAVNFGTAFTNVFSNLAVMGEGAIDILPGVEAKGILEWKNQSDKTLENYNAISAQAWDALTNAQIWGYLVGALTGAKVLSIGAEQVGIKLVEEEAINYKHIKDVADEMASKLNLSGAAAQALTPQTMVQMFDGGEYATLGTRLWLNGLTAANRSLEVTNATLSAISGAAQKNTITEYLLDTLHDAIVFDGSTLRNVIEAVRSDDNNENRQQVINYWIGQFAENALYWAPIGIARSSIKMAGKTAFGKAANAVLTKFINKVSAKVGYKKMSIKDKLANGSVIKKLEEDIEKAISNDEFTKAMRLQRKLDIENWNSITRDARKRLGDLELKWEDGKLTAESLYEFRNFVNDVKILENGIDAYNRNIVNKIDEYTVKQIDPSTGMRRYLNPDLGSANEKVTMYYWDLVDLNKKYKLPVAKDSLLNQDVVDYWMNSYYKRLADKFADSDGLNAVKAQNASGILQANIDALSETVPEEIKTYIDNMLDRKIFQEWYFAQNEYGMSKGLLNRDRTMSYQNNPIWQETGYMPIRVQKDLSGRWIPDDGRIDAVIEQDWEALKFNVNEGQHYADPELVRQSRLKKLAQAEVNNELFKAYKGFTNSATNITKISGPETAYVNAVKSNMNALDTAISDSSASVFKENFNVKPQIDKDKKFTKNIVVSEDTRTTVTAGMSPSQTRDFLMQKKVLDGPTAKLTDNVTAENYDDWFKQQSTPVKKYLVQQYSQFDDAVKVADQATDSAAIIDRLNYIDEQMHKIDELWDKADAERAAYKGFQKTELDELPDWVKEHQKKANGYFDEAEKIAEELGYHEISDATRSGRNSVWAQKANAEKKRLREQLKNIAKNSNADDDVSTGSSIKTKVIEDIVTPSSAPDTPEVPENDIIQQVINGRKIKVKNASSPATSIFVSNGKPNTYELLQKAMENGGDDFEAGLQRAYLAGDDSFSHTSVMNEAARNLENGKEAFYQGVIMAKIKGETKNVKGLNVDAFWDDMLTTIKGQLDDYVARVNSNKGAKAAIEALAKTTNGSEEAARYIALRRLKESYMKDVKNVLHDHIDRLKELDKVPKGDIKLLKSKTDLLLKDVVDTELDEATNIARIINSDLVDSKNIYDEVNALAKEIEGAEARKAEDYIMYLDNQGRQVYAQVDPAFASLFNTRAKITKSQASAMARFNALASRAFRYGTTSVNLAAFGNQMFRDFGNAILVGGAWQTIKTNADNLRDVFGDRIVEQIKAFDPDDYEMRQVARLAQESGQTIQEAAVSRELMRGSAIAGTTTETSLYRDFMKQAYGDKSGDILTRTEGKLKELWKKYDPDKYMNGKRENYLRNRVYASSLNDAMKEGYTLQQARVYAEFAMNNATTNFSRQLYHMQAIADSTPYFRATINGTKSFWRMWSLDPVGISGRIMGGLVLPVMFLTGASLGSDENRKVYKNIPEYQKKDAIVFVMNGEPVSIQIPQELSPIVSPFRQFVEYLYDSNPNDFWELMSNDLLGFLPYDMTGFTAIDYDRMIDDPTFFDRTSRGFARLFSQMAPIPLKSAYMIASGTDPYTGKWLRDPSYAYWNDETNSIEVMDYYQSTFASYFAKLFPNMNPAVADKVISGVFGSTGSNLLGDITALLMNGPEAALLSVGQNVFEQATKPVTVEKYDLTDAVWKRAVRQLTAKKEGITSSKEWKALNTKLSQTKDPETRQKLISQRQDMVDEYQQEVAKMVERLASEYQGTFDRQKFAAVVALLNFNSDTAYQEGSQYSSDIASELYWNGRDAAIHTMERLGITGTNDMSIFGYLTTDRDGNPVMKYSSPVAIMDMSNQWQNQDDVNAANIKALLTQNKMYDAHKSISDQIDKIYKGKKKLSNQDYATIDAIKINWNAQLAKVIAPYVATMTPEAAINNREVLNLLYPYVEVPNSWSNKSVGSRGNKKQAYYESWIKSMFSVNDPYKGQY